MDIIIAANFCRDFSETDNGRFVYLAKLLSKEHNVEIITSDFYHGKKTHRGKLETQWPFKITFIHEPGYKKNVSLQRLRSHKQLGKNLKEYLRAREKPDVIYCAVPSLDFAEAAMEYAKEEGIRFIIDIQDLWPEAFKMVFRVPVASDFLFAPMEKQANRIYSGAEHVVSVSQTYADRALGINSTASSTVVFLGTEISLFDQYASKAFKASSEKIKLAYIGTLSHSYDLPLVFDALRMLSLEELSLIEFVIMGDGPLKSVFEKKSVGLPVIFTGALPYPEMVNRLMQCDIAINPIVKGSAGSIINKVGDYAMSGLPVINTQECPEYRKLIEEYTAGINCKCENAEDLAKAIRRLIKDSSLRELLGKGNRRMALEKFDRALTYSNIASVIVGTK